MLSEINILLKSGFGIIIKLFDESDISTFGNMNLISFFSNAYLERSVPPDNHFSQFT